ncbi:SIMPL domain-containing protein [Alteromonas sp. ASW11-36]|uniref:SIMPL domain-containing protein n=1 Tax=Alteromonas arenosi TaxID=3055817 RepID=A0ABT7SXH6_9ALTE|nr:SIMPL domain-containing protein [Alteromonas sp. ASW11-36]MDM7860887.1 SIMPL domain-containing protein [Alteromonas sp. ASW11-36]
MTTWMAKWVISIGLFLPAVVAQAQLYSQNNQVLQRTVTVQGQGAVSAIPDRFRVVFSVELKGPVATKLNEQIEEKTRAIINALDALEVDRSYVRTMQISLRPGFEMRDRERIQIGFVLTRMISVNHSSIGQYGQLIDAVLRAGATGIENFEFIVSNADALYEQALALAMQDAQKKAEVIVRPTKDSIGYLISVNQHHNQGIPQHRAMTMDAEMSTALAGTQVINANVTAVFSLL